MLERFLVPEKDRVFVEADNMRQATIEIFEKCGLSPEDAALSAEVLMTSDLRGWESHGVSNQLRVYVQMYGDQEINPAPNLRVTRETDVTANVDGDTGLGLHVLPKAMEMAIEKADKHGMGAVTVHDPSFLEEYGPAVNAMVEANGGKYIVRDLEPNHLAGGGTVPTVMVVLDSVSSPGLRNIPERKQQVATSTSGPEVNLCATSLAHRMAAAAPSAMEEHM